MRASMERVASVITVIALERISTAVAGFRGRGRCRDGWRAIHFAMRYRTHGTTSLQLIAMPDSTSAPPRIPGYDLSVPTEDTAVAALGRVFGEESGRIRWADACRAAGLIPGRVGTGERLTRVTEALSKQGGASATVAQSIAIRIRTHTRLAARTGAPAIGAAR